MWKLFEDGLTDFFLCCRLGFMWRATLRGTNVFEENIVFIFTSVLGEIKSNVQANTSANTPSMNEELKKACLCDLL